jgi:hypothetical protein
MSLTDISLILIFVVVFCTGLVVIIRSRSINNRIFEWSASLLKTFGEIPDPEGQRTASLWIIRIFSFLVMSVCTSGLYILLTDIFR